MNFDNDTKNCKVQTDLVMELPGLALSRFFQVPAEGQKEVIGTISVEFVNNTADVAGTLFVWRLC